MKQSTNQLIKETEEYGARNYSPLPIVVAKAEGALVTNLEGDNF